MIKAILFDLDGVVIKHPLFSTVYAAEFGITPEDMLPFFTKEFDKCQIGELDLKVAVAPYLKSWKWTKSVDEFLEYWFTHHKTVETDVLAYIDKLRAKGIECHLQTNQEKYRAAYIWQTLGLKNHFDGLFVSCDLGSKKPQTAFYTKILAVLKNYQPDEILFVDDSKNFISGAQNVGLLTWHYTDLPALQQHLAKKLTKL